VLVNGRILTVDPQGTVTEAVAVTGGKIVAVGSNEQIRSRVGENTVQLVDAARMTVGVDEPRCHGHLLRVDHLRPARGQVPYIARLDVAVDHDQVRLDAGPRWPEMACSPESRPTPNAPASAAPSPKNSPRVFFAIAFF
jgi:hypothetical protein